MIKYAIYRECSETWSELFDTRKEAVIELYSNFGKYGYDAVIIEVEVI